MRVLSGRVQRRSLVHPGDQRPAERQVQSRQELHLLLHRLLVPDSRPHRRPNRAGTLGGGDGQAVGGDDQPDVRVLLQDHRRHLGGKRRPERADSLAEQCYNVIITCIYL